MGVKETLHKAGTAATSAGATTGEVISMPIKFVGTAVGKVGESIADVLHLKEALKKFFEALKELIGGKKALAERLDDIENQIMQNIDNGNYTNDQLQKLNETVASLAGKMRNMSPEAMEATELEALEELEKLRDSMYGEGRLVDAKAYEPNFIAALKTLSGHEDMDDAEFKKYFSENAKLYDDGHLKPETEIGEDGKEHNKTAGTSSMLIELDGKCFQAEFNVSEIEPSEEDPEIKTRKFKLSVSNYEGSYNNAKELLVKPELGAHETMMREFLLPRGLRREEDFRRIDLKRLEKSSTAFRDYSTIKKFSENVIESQDSKNEFTYDSKNNIFVARDKDTGNALVFKMVKQELQMITLDATKSLDEIVATGGSKGEYSFRGGSENVSEQATFSYDAGKGITRYSVASMDANKSALLYTPQVMEFLSTKGINGKDLMQSLISESSKNIKGYSRVDREGMDKVDRMYQALYSTIEASDTSLSPKNIRDSRKFRKTGDNGAVYLSVSDKEGNTMSFSFSQDGSPCDLNYKAKDGKKFRFAQNLITNHFGADYISIRYEEHFAQLLSICQQAYNLYAENEAAISRNIAEDSKEAKREAEKIEATTSQANELRKWCDAPASSVTDNYYRNVPLLQASANYVIQNRHLSAAQIQRTFAVDYRMAEKIIQRLERDGLISNANGKLYRLAVDSDKIAEWKPTSFAEEKDEAPAKDEASAPELTLPEQKWISDVTRLVYPEDTLVAACANFAMQNGEVTRTRIQREFKIGWNKASEIADRLEKDGIISKSEGEVKELHPNRALMTPSILAEEKHIEFKSLPLSDANMQKALKGIQEHPEKAEFDKASLLSYGVEASAVADVYDTLRNEGAINTDSRSGILQVKGTFDMQKIEQLLNTVEVEVVKSEDVPETKNMLALDDEFIQSALTAAFAVAGDDSKDSAEKLKAIEQSVPEDARNEVMESLHKLGVIDGDGINGEVLKETLAKLGEEMNNESKNDMNDLE